MSKEVSTPPAPALLAAFQQVAEAVFITDAQGTIQFANPAFQTVTGYAPEEAIGRTPKILKSGHHDSDFYAAMWATISDGQVWRGSVVNRRKDGGHYNAEASITPLRGEDGTVTHYVAVQRDVTTLRQTQKLEALGMITATIAHELNNPLSFLLMNIDVVRDVWTDASPLLDQQVGNDLEARLARLPWPEVRETVPKLLAGMKSGAERLQRMCQELRTFTRDEERTPPHEFFLDESLEGALQLLGPKLTAAKIRVDLETPGGLPALLGWPGELEQVLVNLLVNAMDVVPEGMGRILIQVTHAQNQLEIVVRDNGPGVPVECRHRVFEPFFTTRASEGGTGLGLAISRRIIARMNGDLTLIDDDQPGAAFRIRLPTVPS